MHCTVGCVCVCVSGMAGNNFATFHVIVYLDFCAIKYKDFLVSVILLQFKKNNDNFAFTLQRDVAPYRIYGFHGGEGISRDLDHEHVYVDVWLSTFRRLYASFVVDRDGGVIRSQNKGACTHTHTHTHRLFAGVG